MPIHNDEFAYPPPVKKRHCDEIIDDESQPKCLRDFLHYHRLPAVCQLAGQPPDVVAQARKYIEPDLQRFVWTDPRPHLFASYCGRRARVVMASRFGDVGITFNLLSDRGYEKRVAVDDLQDFSATA